MPSRSANEDLTLPQGANGRLYGISVVQSQCPPGNLTRFLTSVLQAYRLTVLEFITHAGIAASVDRAFSRVCLFVRTLKGKRLEISTPNLIHIYSIAIARHILTHTSKGQRSRSHGYENRHGARLLVTIADIP